MQYPIIDNLIYAYLKNGWTGLEVYNIFPLFNVQTTTSYNLRFEQDGSYGVVGRGVPTWTIEKPSFRICFLSLDDYNLLINNNYRVIGFCDNEYFSLNTLSLSSDRSIVAQGRAITTQNYTELKINIMFYKDENPSSYNPNIYDIAHRLKLLLPHYFPHPVIDALISASDGQQTEEENEILRHYLTPLGIGGI